MQIQKVNKNMKWHVIAVQVKQDPNICTIIKFSRISKKKKNFVLTEITSTSAGAYFLTVTNVRCPRKARVRVGALHRLKLIYGLRTTKLSRLKRGNTP